MRRPQDKLLAWTLIALMAVGSVFLWLGIPFLWIYGASQTVDTQQPTLGPYLVVIIGIPVSMVIVGRLLSGLNRMYGDLTGTTQDVRVRLPWHRSLRGERDSGRPRTMLDVVMVISVGLALLTMAVWFFFFAEGGGLPG